MPLHSGRICTSHNGGQLTQILLLHPKTSSFAQSRGERAAWRDWGAEERGIWRGRVVDGEDGRMLIEELLLLLLLLLLMTMMIEMLLLLLK